VVENRTIEFLRQDFLLVFNSNYRPTVHRFPDMTTGRTTDGRRTSDGRRTGRRWTNA